MVTEETASNRDGDSEVTLDAQWKAVCGLLRAEIGEAAYMSWLKPMTVRAISDGRVKISVPTRFMRDWIVAHYLDRLCDLWNEENPEVHSVDIYVKPEREPAGTEVEPLAAIRGDATYLPVGDHGGKRNRVVGHHGCHHNHIEG